MNTRPIILAVCLSLLSLPCSAKSNNVHVGSVELHPCQDAPALCGDFERPLDPTAGVPGMISIHFEFYPHTGPGKAAGTLVATEGGPGYPATLSRDDYLDLFAPLRATRDVVLMDNRGTGQSGAVDCHALQTAEQWTIADTAACGTSLAERAPMYSTAYAADDLAAILQALGVERIDLYGDSYGTYFEQVFAVRHPALLRSIILDGAYPLDGPDYAWYPTYAGAMRDKFNLACQRSEGCSKLPGSSMDHILPALQGLRARPEAASAADSDGEIRQFMADASKLAIVMFGSAPALATVREIDAAARAFSTGDHAPMYRLMAETTSAVDSRDPSGNAAKWSAGLAAAVMCQDSGQIFDMKLSPAQRILDRDRAIADRKARMPQTYAPFSIDEYRGMPLDYSFIDQCVEWPSPPASHPASQVVPADSKYPDVPALIISGDLDNMTTPADGAAVAAEFKQGRQVLIVNSFHVNALPRSRSGCGAMLARRFIETLVVGDTSCASEVPPVRLLVRFAEHAAELAPLDSVSGNSASPQQLRWAHGVLLTAGDVLTRAIANSTGSGVGLRGGKFTVTATAKRLHLTLSQVRWSEDLKVSGTLVKAVARSGEVHGALQFDAADGTQGQLTLKWTEGGANPHARIGGRIGGRAVSAVAPAP
jgi:pimeloyl-ACP methyl ester carboxylesterase